MPATTTRNGLRTPLTTEAPDAPQQIGNLANDVEQYIGAIGVEYCANLAAVNAIPAARLYTGKRALAADTQAIYRWNGSAWRPWTWQAITQNEWDNGGQNGAGGDTNGGIYEMNLADGIAIWHFNYYRGAGMGTNTAYGNLKPGYRPAGPVPFSGVTLNNSGQDAAAMMLDASGNLILLGGGVGSPTSMRGTVHFRPA